MPKFKLNQRVRIACSEERGEVVGVAVYSYTNEATYLIRYTAGDGRAVEAWWTESALVEVNA